MKPFEGKRIYLLGDSISSTDYVWYKEALEEETGALVYNAGFSGHKTESIASNTAFQRLIDFDADITVALVMGNDTGEKGTVGTFSSSSPNGLSGEPLAEETDLAKDFLDPVTKNPQSPLTVCGVSHIIRKWRDLFYDFKRIAGVTGGVFNDDEETYRKLEAVKKRKLIFCTTLPQKRENDQNPFSNPENWLRKRNAVIECCEKYRVPCLDLYSLLPWDFSREPYWVSPTSMVENRGIYTMDGLHPNKFGYRDIAHLVAEFLKTH